MDVYIQNLIYIGYVIQIVDTDNGFYVIEGGRAWPAGMDAYDLANCVQAVQCALADDEIPFGGMIIPSKDVDVLRLRGAKILVS